MGDQLLACFLTLSRDLFDPLVDWVLDQSIEERTRLCFQLLDLVHQTRWFNAFFLGGPQFVCDVPEQRPANVRRPNKWIAPICLTLLQ